MKLKMTIGEAMNFADEWSRGLTLHEDSQGWRVACMILAEEVRRLQDIERAARNVYRVKGRYNTQIATCRLGEKLGLPVTWPAKMRICVEAAGLPDTEDARAPHVVAEGPSR